MKQKTDAFDPPITFSIQYKFKQTAQAEAAQKRGLTLTKKVQTEMTI